MFIPAIIFIALGTLGAVALIRAGWVQPAGHRATRRQLRRWRRDRLVIDVRNRRGES